MSDVSDIPIACSLDAADLAARTEEVRLLAARALIGRERTLEGQVLRFRDSADTEAELRGVIARERACCPFFEFALERRDGELRLLVTAPEAAQPLIDSLFTVGAPQPLDGKRVLVTRPAGQAGEFLTALRAAGAEPVLMPAIEIRPLEDTRVLDEALRRILEHDWVIFTSANGVRHVWERLAALGLEDVLEDGEEGRKPGQPRVAAIGPGTAAALERRGVHPDYVPAEYVAEALAAGLPVAEGARVLMLRADIARATLRERLEARGARVDDVAAYRTITGTAQAGSDQTESEPSPAVDAVTFTSSSTVRGFLNAGGRVPEGAAVVCIGPVTARTARELGLRVDAVAQLYTLEGLVEALVRHFGGANPRGGRLRDESETRRGKEQR
jgi:uroporphyrinogen-III synthase